MNCYDMLIIGGCYFDGIGGFLCIVYVVIWDGWIVCVFDFEFDFELVDWVIYVDGYWVIFGFFDIYIYYDVELIVVFLLFELVCYGVIIVLIGSCFLSMVCLDVEDVFDIFICVEIVFWEKVLLIFQKYKNWRIFLGWLSFICEQFFGFNVISFFGYSDFWVGVMGLYCVIDCLVVLIFEEMGCME